MTQDLLQTYSMLGANPLTAAALGSSQLFSNPGIPQFGYGGGIQHPIQHLQQQLQQQLLQQQLLQQQLHQQLQQQLLQQQLLQQQAPLAAMLGVPGITPQFGTGAGHNPLTGIGALSNPSIWQSLQNPLSNPILTQLYQQQYPHQQQYPQIAYGAGLPFGGSSPFVPFGHPLAPQSWIGQQGLGVGTPFSPLHALAGGRGVQGHGMAPWLGF